MRLVFNALCALAFVAFAAAKKNPVVDADPPPATPPEGEPEVSAICVEMVAESEKDLKTWDSVANIDKIASMSVLELMEGSQACIEKETYGFWTNRYWVSDFCSAKFRICAEEGAEEIKNVCKTKTVKSGNKGKKWTSVKGIGTIGYIEVLKVKGQAGKCVEGESYGFLVNRIWADKGCKAEFKVCRFEPVGDVETESDDVPGKEADEDAKQRKEKNRLERLFGKTNEDGEPEDFGALVDRIKRQKKTLYEDKCLCRGWGDPHYAGADGSSLHFQGICEYVVVRTTSNFGQCNFVVTTQNEHRDGNDDVSFVMRVNIYMFGSEISLMKNNEMRINGLTIEDSEVTIADQFTVIRGGGVLAFKSEVCNIQVTYKDDHIAEVVFSKEYAGQVNGLCGNCDGNIENDYRLSDGTIPPADKSRSARIGDSWVYSNSRDGSGTCDATAPTPVTEECDDTSRAQAELLCSMLEEESGPFAKCLTVITRTATNTLDSCIQDVCMFINNPISVRRLVCENFDTFEAACEEAGVLVDDWREAAGCAPECQANAVLSMFTPLCQPSCSNPNPTDPCFLDVGLGCLCEEGYLLSGSECVPPEQCGCHSNGRYYPIGSSMLSRKCNRKYECKFDDARGRARMEQSDFECPENSHCDVEDGARTCVCNRNYNRVGDACVLDEEAERQQKEREQKDRDLRNSENCYCDAWGDPHYKTFDDFTIHFQGACTYLISGTRDQTGPCAFSVKAFNEFRDKETVTVTTIIYIEAGGDKIIIGRKKQLTVNGIARTVPTYLASGVKIVESGRFYKVVTPCEVQVSFDGVQRAVITVPRTLADREDLVGLCGDCDGIPDEYVLANGTDVSDLPDKSNLVGISFQVPNPEGRIDHDNCSNPYTEPECPPEFKAEVEGPTHCGMLVDPDGPFADCLKTLGADSGFVQNIFESCSSDQCAFHDNPEERSIQLCAAASELADKCAAEGIKVTWRTPDFCPLQCPDYSSYAPVMSGCQATCLSPEPVDTCALDDVEGCQCDEGYLLEGGQCIQREDCGCVDDNGNYAPIDTSIISDDCTKISKCGSTIVGATFTVTNQEHGTCDEDAHCVLDEDTDALTCECNEGFTGTGYDCQPTPPPPENPPPITPPTDEGESCQCIASGDPHITQTDGGTLQVTEPCKFIFSGTPDAPSASGDVCNFRVEIKNEIHPTHISRAFVRLVDIILPTVRIRFGQDLTVFTADNTAPVPVFTELNFLNQFTFANEATITLSGAKVEVVTICGARVSFDGKNLVELDVHSDYSGQLIGLCGNCDGDADNDRTVNGMRIGDFGPDHTVGYIAVARQHMVIDDSDVPNTSPRCTPAET